MITKQKIIALSVAAFAVALGLGTAGVVSAHRAQSGERLFSSEQRTAVIDAVKQRDYSAFKEIVGDEVPFAKNVTEENFDAFAERFEKHIENGEGFLKRGRSAHRKFHKNDGRFEAVKNAFETQDYDAWVEAVGEKHPFADMITEDNFADFIRMHELKKNGNFDEARAIAEEIGLDSEEFDKHHKRHRKWKKAKRFHTEFTEHEPAEA